MPQQGGGQYECGRVYCSLTAKVVKLGDMQWGGDKRVVNTDYSLEKNILKAEGLPCLRTEYRVLCKPVLRIWLYLNKKVKLC